MMRITGKPELQRRLRAIGDTGDILRGIQLAAVREAKLLVPRKTGNLGRSIVPGNYSRDRAIVKAKANYAAFVELGTRPHVIRPRNKKMLSWPASKADARLSGPVRKGGKRVFARKVNHPGTKPQPFLLPGAKKAVEGAGLRTQIIDRWNRAA